MIRPMRTTAIKAVLKLTFYSLPLIAFVANSTGSRGRVAASAGAPELSAPVKVTIFKSHGALAAGLTRFPDGSLKFPSATPTPQQVKAYVQAEALQHGVDPKLALWIVKHESSFNPHAKGDGEASRGLWQISKIYHPEVTDSAAFNVTSSTEWSLDRIRSGKVNEWSTYRRCRSLYEDCPF
jgi:hypothetical protein